MNKICYVVVCCLLGLQVNAQQDGRSTDEKINLKVGAVWSVSLVSNPTTGYQWETYVLPDGQVFIKVEDKFEAPHVPQGMAGVPGKHLWTITALKPGEAKVELRYRRPWLPPTNSLPDKTYRFFITK